jgi:hypothetical protein
MATHLSELGIRSSPFQACQPPMSMIHANTAQSEGNEVYLSEIKDCFIFKIRLVGDHHDGEKGECLGR